MVIKFHHKIAIIISKSLQTYTYGLALTKLENHVIVTNKVLANEIIQVGELGSIRMKNEYVQLNKDLSGKSIIIYGNT